MSFRDLLDTASSLALADKLAPTEISIWEKYCREYSTRFSTSLTLVMDMDPLFVIRMITSDNLSELDIEERLPEVFEMIYSLSDPSYDSKKEQAIRDEMAQIEEREAERIRKGEAIHSSMEKDKRVIVKDQPTQLPKSGGLN